MRKTNDENRIDGNRGAERASYNFNQEHRPLVTGKFVKGFDSVRFEVGSPLREVNA